MHTVWVEVAPSPADGAPGASWFTHGEIKAGETELFPKPGNTIWKWEWGGLRYACLYWGFSSMGSEENHFLALEGAKRM